MPERLAGGGAEGADHGAIGAHKDFIFIDHRCGFGHDMERPAAFDHGAPGDGVADGEGGRIFFFGDVKVGQGEDIVELDVVGLQPLIAAFAVEADEGEGVGDFGLGEFGGFVAFDGDAAFFEAAAAVHGVVDQHDGFVGDFAFYCPHAAVGFAFLADEEGVEGDAEFTGFILDGADQRDGGDLHTGDLEGEFIAVVVPKQGGDDIHGHLLHEEGAGVEHPGVGGAAGGESDLLVAVEEALGFD